MNDFLEKLADIEVRQPPPEFDRQLHERLNRSLVSQHLLDLLVGGLPWAMLHFARALVGLVIFSLTGKFEEGPRKEDP
jgi:hypothetical protein